MVSNQDTRVKLRLVAEEISFARILASNEKRLRDRGVKRLRRFLIARSQRDGGLSEDDYLRLWKGLFYCMWMSDKPLIQEQLAEDISLLVHCFSTFKESMNFVECFFSALSSEWYGIDQLRLDKFMMLVRRFIRQSLMLMKKLDWRTDNVKSLADYFYKILTTAPIGLCMHIVEIYCEELAKIGEGKLSSDTIVTLIYPFAKYLSTQKDGRLISDITRWIFLYLIRQTEKGIEHQMKYSIWKERGFAGGSIDAVQKVEDADDLDDDEDYSNHNGADFDDDLLVPDSEEEELDKEQKYEIDARAGRVDVLLPPLDFDPQSFVKIFSELKNHKETTTKARKTILQLIDKFTKLHQGKYPLGLQKIELPNRLNKKAEVAAAARRLLKEEMNYEMNADIPIGLEVGDDGDDDSDKVKLSKIQKRVGPINKEVGKERKNMNTWKVCDAVSKKNDVKPVLNKGWAVNTLDASTKKGVKRKHETGEINKPSGKFIITELNSCVDTYKRKKRKNKAEEDIGSNILQMQLDVNSVSMETSSISAQNEKCNAESESVAKQNCINSELKQNSQKKGNIKGDVKNSPKVNRVKVSETSLKVNGLAEVNGNMSRTEISDWGGEWDVPLETGDTEIIIPIELPTRKQKLQHTPSAGGTGDGATPENRINKLFSSVTPSNSGSKRVEFVLARNTAQEIKEYKRMVKNNSKIPFSAEKKPVQGVLKSTPVSSPINPFYRLSDSFKCF